MFERICLICSCKTKIPINIFSKTFSHQGVGVDEMYKQCCQLPIDEEDTNMPKQICVKCLEKLRDAYDLFKTADTAFKGFLNEIEKEEQRKAAEQIKKEKIKRKSKETVLELKTDIKLPKIDLIDSYIEKAEIHTIQINQNMTDCTKTDETKFNCSYCHKSFLTTKALVFHKKIMHKNIT